MTNLSRSFRNVASPTKKGRYILLLSLLLLTPSACNKDEQGIPNVPVDININTNLPRYSELRAVGGWVYLTGGSKGIIAYRFSTNEFKAFDRHCSYRPSENCGRAQVDSSDIKIHCRACEGSEYSIADGSVIKGPASRPLKRYNTSFDGSILRIYN